MANLNLVILSGRVGQDPEIKTFETGAMKSSFSVATSKRWVTKEGEKKEETQWHKIETWGGLTKLVEGWVKKGQVVTIQGELAYEKFTNKEGVEVQMTKIRAQQIDIGGSSNGANTASGNQQGHTQSNQPALLPENDDDLPF